MRYLKNNGVPSKITIYLQGAVSYRTQKGDLYETRVITYNTDNGEVKQEAEDRKLPKGKKMYVNFRNGELYNEVIHDEGHSFTVENYPHIIEFPIGRDKKTEKRYTIKVGEIAEIPDEADAEILLKTFHFLDEVDQKGDIIAENPYKSKFAKPVDFNLYPRNFTDWDSEKVPRRTPRKERITKFVEGGEELKEK